MQELLPAAMWARHPLLGFAEIDVAVKSRELNLGSTAIDQSVHSAIELHAIFPLAGSVLLNYRLPGRRIHGDFEVAIDRSVVSLEFYPGLHIRRQGDVDIAV